MSKVAVDSERGECRGTNGMEVLLELCRREWEAIAASSSLLDAADRYEVQYLCQGARQHFRTDDAWRAALEKAEPAALALLLGLAARLSSPRFAEAGLALLRVTALHGAEALVLELLRLLILVDDERVFRACLPFCARRWNQGWLDFSAARCGRRAELLSAFLEGDSGAIHLAARSSGVSGEVLGALWPKLGEAPASDEPPPFPHYHSMYAKMLTDTYHTVGPNEQERLRSTARRVFSYAASHALRCTMATALARLGEVGPCLELCESIYHHHRQWACGIAVRYAAPAFLKRFGHIFVGEDSRLGPLRETFERSQPPRRAAPVLCSDGRLVLAYQPCQWDPRCWYTEDVFQGLRLLRFEPRTGELQDFELVRAQWEAQRTRLSFPPELKGRVLLLEVMDNRAVELRFYLHFDEGGQLQMASTKKEAKVLLSSKRRAGAVTTGGAAIVGGELLGELPKQAEEKQTSSSTVPRKAKKKEDFELRRVGQGRTSTEGVLSVSGADFLAVFRNDSDAPLCSPPNAVAICLTESLMMSWRTERHRARSGVGRGDYVWILELYSFPEPVRFLRSYRIRAQSVIEWCWPVSLSVPKAQKRQVVTLKARSEDWVRLLYVVLHPDGVFSETLDRATALALSSGKAHDASKLVSHRVQPDRLPLSFGGSRVSKALQRYLEGLERVGYPLRLCGAADASALEQLVGLPRSLRELWLQADGEYDEDGSFWAGYAFLGVEQSVAMGVEPAGCIAFAKESLRDNYLGVALRDAKDWQAGAVMSWGEDEQGIRAVLPSFEAFVEYLAEAVEAGALRWVQARGRGETSYLMHRGGRLGKLLGSRSSDGASSAKI